jgi:hypothetical protein
MFRNPFRRRNKLSRERVNAILNAWLGETPSEGEGKRQIDVACKVADLLSINLLQQTLFVGSSEKAWATHRPQVLGYAMGFSARALEELERREAKPLALFFAALTGLSAVMGKAWDEDEVCAEWDRYRCQQPLNPMFKAGVQAGIDDAAAQGAGKSSHNLMALLPPKVG